MSREIYIGVLTALPGVLMMLVFGIIYRLKHLKDAYEDLAHVRGLFLGNLQTGRFSDEHLVEHVIQAEKRVAGLRR